MKTLLLTAMILSSASAFAKGSDRSVAAISTNPEVVSLVAAMEKNRGLRCDSLSPYSLEVGKRGYATALYGCNQYDEAGQPMANVTQIEVKGWVTANGFDLMQVKFIPVE